MRLIDGYADRIRAHTEALNQFFDRMGGPLREVSRQVAAAMRDGHKLMLCGNGGSAADCQHIAAEFTNRFKLERPPLPALALTTDTSAITSIGNDYSFEQIFQKQVRALGQRGDVLVGISTSGNSPNIIRAVETAKEMGIVVVALTGGTGGKLAALADRHLCVDATTETAVIQEVHITALHMMCQMVDELLFPTA